MPMPDFVRILNRRINWNSSGRYYGPTSDLTTNIPFLFEEGAEAVNSTNAHVHGLITNTNNNYDE